MCTAHVSDSAFLQPTVESSRTRFLCSNQSSPFKIAADAVRMQSNICVERDDPAWSMFSGGWMLGAVNVDSYDTQL
jgi:hypothetical protein